MADSPSERPDVRPAFPAQAAAVGASPHAGPAPGDRVGLAAAWFSFVFWGVVPLYWALLKHVPPGEILLHRIVWSGLFALGVLALRRTLGGIRALPRRTWPWVFGSAVALAANWGIFILAVNTGHVLEASLGYYLTPLATAAVGVLAFRERLSRGDRIAFGLATAGVAAIVLDAGALPLVALGLCVSWSVYGGLRKAMGLEPVLGLALETIVLGPAALGLLAWLALRGEGAFLGVGLGTDLLLVTAGLVTALPLLAFNEAARRVPLTTLGLLQFVTPSLTFLLGVFVYREPFSLGQAVGFVLIVAGIVLRTRIA